MRQIVLAGSLAAARAGLAAPPAAAQGQITLYCSILEELAALRAQRMT